MIIRNAHPLPRFGAVLPLKVVSTRPVVWDMDLSSHALAFDTLLNELNTYKPSEVSGTDRSDPRIFLGSLDLEKKKMKQAFCDNPVLEKPHVQAFLKKLCHDVQETLHTLDPRVVLNKMVSKFVFNRYRANPDPAKNKPLAYHDHDGLITGSVVLNSPGDYQGAQLKIKPKSAEYNLLQDQGAALFDQKQYHGLFWDEAESYHGLAPITQGVRTMMALTVDWDSAYKIEMRSKALNLETPN